MPFSRRTVISMPLGTLSASTIGGMSAVVLRGPSNAAPESIVGPFSSMDEAVQWAQEHPRDGGYSVAQEITDPVDAG
jgi:hypothetical protein